MAAGLHCQFSLATIHLLSMMASLHRLSAPAGMLLRVTSRPPRAAALLLVCTTRYPLSQLALEQICLVALYTLPEVYMSKWKHKQACRLDSSLLQLDCDCKSGRKAVPRG